MYYDTNVWIGYMLGEQDYYFPLCKPLIDNLESGKKVAVVSYAVILEVIDTMRRKIPKRMEFTGGSREECGSKIPLIDAKIVEFVKKINKYAKERKILIIKPYESVSKHQSTILQKLRSYFGYIRVMSTCPSCKDGVIPRDSNVECPKCGKSIDPVKKYQYKGLGYVDLEHAYLAKYGNASTFYTSDTSFKSLNHDEYFKPMRFTIIPHPSRIQ